MTAVATWVLKRFGLGPTMIAAGLFIGLSAALSWHYIDKASAVRNAEQALADTHTIATQKAQLKELKRRVVAADEAKKKLDQEKTLAEVATIKAEQDLADYEQDTEQNIECIVDQRLLDRLQ